MNKAGEEQRTRFHEGQSVAHQIGGSAGWDLHIRFGLFGKNPSSDNSDNLFQIHDFYLRLLKIAVEYGSTLLTAPAPHSPARVVPMIKTPSAKMEFKPSFEV
jgi:hypothetical protein